MQPQMEQSEQSRGSQLHELPMPKHQFVNLVKLCVDFDYFEFAGDEYQQVKGITMGPLQGYN